MGQGEKDFFGGKIMWVGQLQKLNKVEGIASKEHMGGERRVRAAREELPDEQLVAGAKAGQTRAFDQLVARYRGKVYAMIYSMVRNEADAWDLSQEAFIKAWRALPRFNGDSAFYTWLYRISHNVVYDWMRKKRVKAETEFDDELRWAVVSGAPTAPGIDRAPDESMEGKELGERLEGALGQLSANHREVVVLREVEGLSYAEIAVVMGCSEGTVMSRLFYARKKLQEILSDGKDH
jgi:RNA polymerase sigma-70 factor, ECF subfamily